MKLLLIDGHFMMHRARSGFTQGDYPVIYNFFRGLKAQFDYHKPDSAMFIIEGHAKARYELLPEYKATRIVDSNVEPEKHAELVKFHRQKELILDLLMQCFPFPVIRHPDYECDDVLANLAIKAVGSGDVDTAVVVSGDSDFIQLLDDARISLYHPIRKEFIVPPTYDYVTWKALKGDATDNISGLPGVGDKTAEKLVTGPIQDLNDFLIKNNFESQFCRNTELIHFHSLSNDEMNSLEKSPGKADWEHAAVDFRMMGFNSFFKGDYWQKFQATFDRAGENK